MLVVQGGPGTGKTVVALHRAAYLLYTHRFPLEDQGVLVIGPNRVFLRYIERVLPSLGEAGVEQVVLSDLVPGVQFLRPDDRVGADSPTAARIKGDDRMSDVIDQAVNDRERPLRDDLVIPFRTGYVRLRVEESARIVKNARRRFRRHNSGRKFVENEVWSALAATYRDPEIGPRDVKDTLRGTPEIREALDRMWPLLTPAQLLARPVRVEGACSSSPRAACSTRRRRWRCSDRGPSRSTTSAGRRPTWRCSTMPATCSDPKPGRNGKIDDADEIRTYGHIVIDEVQDLTPMQLKMATRRSLNGAMTIVGDLAQATGPAGADRVAGRARPPARPQAVAGDRAVGRLSDSRPDHGAGEQGDGRGHADAAGAAVGARRRCRARRSCVPDGPLGAAVADEVRSLTTELPNASLGVIAPDSMIDDLSEHLTAAGVNHGTATRTGLDEGVTLVPVSVVKGLELDAVVVVEPARIVADHEHGMRSLYVALTRPTQRLSVVHADDLPEPLR